MTDNNNSNNKDNNNLDNNNEEIEDDNNEFRKYFQKSGIIRKKAEKKSIELDKLSVIGSGNKEEIELNQEETKPLYEQYRIILESHSKSISKNSVSIGIWDNDLMKFEVTQRKGKYFETIGHQVGAKLYLFVEEALFLHDSGVIELFINKVPLSVQESFKLLDICNIPIYKFIGYSNLKKLGYVLVRHSLNKSNYLNRLTHHIKSTSIISPSISTSSTSYQPPQNDKVLSNFNFKIKPNSEFNKILETKKNSSSGIHKNISDHYSIYNNYKNIDKSKYIVSRNFIPAVDILSKDLKDFKVFSILPKEGYIEPIINNNATFIMNQTRENLIKSVLKENSIILDKYNILELNQDNDNNQQNNNCNKRKDSEDNSNNSNNNKKSKIIDSETTTVVSSLVNIPDEIYPNTTLNSINRKLKIFKTKSILNNKEFQSVNINPDRFIIDYDIYKPGSHFKKTDPGLPDFYLSILKFGHQVPSMNDIARLHSINSLNNTNIPIQFCVVNQKDVSFIEFKENLVLTNAFA